MSDGEASQATATAITPEEFARLQKRMHELEEERHKAEREKEKLQKELEESKRDSGSGTPTLGHSRSGSTPTSTFQKFGFGVGGRSKELQAKIDELTEENQFLAKEVQRIRGDLEADRDRLQSTVQLMGEERTKLVKSEEELKIRIKDLKSKNDELEYDLQRKIAELREEKEKSDVLKRLGSTPSTITPDSVDKQNGDQGTRSVADITEIIDERNKLKRELIELQRSSTGEVREREGEIRELRNALREAQQSLRDLQYKESQDSGHQRNEINSLQTQLETVRSELEESRQDYEFLQTEVEEKNEEIENLNNQIGRWRKQVEDFKEQALDFENSVNKKDQEILAVKKELQAATQSATESNELSRELDHLKETLAQKDDSLMKSVNEVNSTKKRLNDFRQRERSILTALYPKTNIDDVTDENGLMDVVAAVRELERLHRSKRDNQGHATEVAELQERLQRSETESAELRKKASEARMDSMKSEREIASLTRARQELQDQLKDLRDELETAEVRATDKSTTNEDLEAKIKEHKATIEKQHASIRAMERRHAQIVKDLKKEILRNEKRSSGGSANLAAATNRTGGNKGHRRSPSNLSVRTVDSTMGNDSPPDTPLQRNSMEAEVESNVTAPGGQTTIRAPVPPGTASDDSRGLTPSPTLKLKGPVDPAKLRSMQHAKLPSDPAKLRQMVKFYREHVDDLTMQLQNKSRLLMDYILREETGSLGPSRMDEIKRKAAMRQQKTAAHAEAKSANSLMGGISNMFFRGGSPSGSSSEMANNGDMGAGVVDPDTGLSLPLAIEVNKKLQSILEDTLLQNIRLQDQLEQQ